MISTELAEAHGTTVRHNIERNRTADYIAKEFANRMTPLNDGFGKRWEAAALEATSNGFVHISVETENST